MAKIVYHVSAFDHAKKKDLEIKGTIRDILTVLKIQDMPVCVIINGVVPDECDLNYETKDDDLIEIHKIVEGEGSASGKQSLALIVQIAALVVVSYFSAGLGTGWTLAILTGSSLISGALNKRAFELSSPSGQDISEQDISANQYSLTNSTNQARPLEPLALPMGSMRYTPDFQADALRSVVGYNYNYAAITNLEEFIYPGNSSTNGVNATLNNWATMPANYIATGFPRFQIKIAPYHWLTVGEALTPTKEAEILLDVKNYWLSHGNPSSINFSSGSKFIGNNVIVPLIIYHSNSSDPFFGKYDYFFFLARIFEHFGNDLTEYTQRHNALFTGTSFDSQDAFIFDSIGLLSGATSKSFVKISSLTKWYWLLASSETLSTLYPKIQTQLFNALNGLDYTPTNKSNSYGIFKYIIVEGITSVINEGYDFSYQAFNYGVGDLSISDRRIGAYAVVQENIATKPQAFYLPQVLDNYANKWLIKFVNSFVPYFQFIPLSILNIEKKNFVNTDTSFTYGPIPPDNLETSNWIILEGKPGQSRFKCEISGQIYSTTGGSIGTNTVYIQCQYKKDSDVFWADIQLPVLALSNNNTKEINYVLNVYSDIDVDDRLNVRIRKITPDYVNNENGNVCRLYVDNISFFKPYEYYISNPTRPARTEERLVNAAMNIEGLVLTALVVASGQTNKYSAQVDPKCWVYDFTNETWSWTFTRNPAFWFLYFCHGGFLNLNADANGPSPYSYPYSPTTGWVNYPGHPDSTEQIFGVGLTNDEIDLDKIIEWAEWCDDNALFLDMVLKDDTSCSDVLERIANVGRASVTYVGGKISVVYENQSQVPTCMFGMGDMKAGSFSVNYQLQDPVRKVVLKYTNRETWESEEVESIVPYSDPLNVRQVEVSMEGVTEEQQAQRECNILAARQYFQRRTYSWEVDIDGLLVKRGDLVYLSHDATQYGYSGRIRKFLTDSLNNIIGFEGTSILDDSINYVTVKEPNGIMSIYECHVSGEQVLFDEAYPANKASYFITNTLDNTSSDYFNSIPEDFTFIAGSKETPGKLVRISQIESTGDFSFKITAFDEDPAMWSYEFEGLPMPQSFDDTELSLSIVNTELTDLGGGMLRVNWETVNGDMIQIIDESIMAPIEANGSYTFTGGQVTLSLMPGKLYTLILRPFAIGTPFKSVDKRERVWLQ